MAAWRCWAAAPALTRRLGGRFLRRCWCAGLRVSSPYLGMGGLLG
nr:hypothetical protein [Candidatus Freyrarchaeum guaymaensis]